MTKRQKHVLIIRLSALGDVAMIIPVIYSVARQHSETQFTVVTRPFFSRLFINSPSNVNIFSVNTKEEYKGIKGLFRLTRDLSKLGVTHVADLHNVLRSWVLTATFRLKGKHIAIVNKNRGERLRILSHNQITATKSYILRYQEVFARLGLPTRLTFKSLFEGIDEVKTPIEISSNGIGIAPFARYDNKTYPLIQMKNVVQELSKLEYNIYLFGGGEYEKTILEQWEKDIPRVISLVGKYQIEEELAMLSRLKVLISMDSANQHLASLVATPAIVLWGSTTPACGFAGYNQKEDNFLCSHVSCQPCSIAGSNKCKLHSMECLKRISTEEIITKVKEK